MSFHDVVKYWGEEGHTLAGLVERRRESNDNPEYVVSVAETCEPVYDGMQVGGVSFQGKGRFYDDVDGPDPHEQDVDRQRPSR